MVCLSLMSRTMESIVTWMNSIRRMLLLLTLDVESVLVLN